MRSDVSVPVADNALHSPLAEANLLRLRGDLDGAEKKCLSLLKRYPNEPEAHILLGELSADRGDWRRAVEWYELAVDLNPSSVTDRAKLDEARRRIEEEDAAETVEQLGLPEQSPKTPWAVFGILAVLFLVVFIAMAANRGPKPKPAPLNGSFSAGPNQTDSTDSTTGTPPDSTDQPVADNSEKPPPAPENSEDMPLEDRTLLNELKKRSTEGGAISSLVQDTRYHTVTVTYSVPSGGEARKIGATLAKDTLDQATEALIVTVRGISGGQVVFAADAVRAKLNDVESDKFQQDHPDEPDAWMTALLEHEWTPDSKTAPPAATTGTPPATETGTTASTPATDTGTTTSPATTGQTTTSGK